MKERLEVEEYLKHGSRQSQKNRNDEKAENDFNPFHPKVS